MATIGITAFFVSFAIFRILERSSPPTPAEATPLKGMTGHYGIGNPIDIKKLAPGDYTVRVVFTDLVSKQSFTREAAIHVRD